MNEPTWPVAHILDKIFVSEENQEHDVRGIHDLILALTQPAQVMKDEMEL